MISLQERLQTLIIQDGPDFLLKLGIAIIVAFVLYFLIKLLVTKVQKRIEGNALEVTKYTKKMSGLVGSTLFIVLMLFNFLICFEILGLNTALLVGGLTIAIGFAMDETIGNMVAGIMIITSGKIKVGQLIKLLGDINQMVRVQEFHIRYTVVKNLYKQKIIIPNMILLDTPIQTKKTEPLLRGEITLSIGRQYDLDMAKAIIVQTINAHRNVIQHDQTIVLVKSFNAKGYELICYYYYSPTEGKRTDYMINAELRDQVFRILKKNKINPVYPRMVLRVESDL